MVNSPHYDVTEIIYLSEKGRPVNGLTICNKKKASLKRTTKVIERCWDLSMARALLAALSNQGQFYIQYPPEIISLELVA